MIIVGLDPSFSCAGVSVMDTENKIIRISDVRTKIGKKSFENIFWASTRIHKGIKEIIETVGGPDILVSEKPYAGGRFSSGLHTLDATLFYNYIHYYESLKYVYLISSRFLSHVHSKNGIKNYKKSDSTNLVRHQLLPIFEEEGWDIEYGSKFPEKKTFKGGLNNNTAESFIFSTGLAVAINLKKLKGFDGFFLDQGALDELYHVARGLFDNFGDLLFERKELIEEAS